MPYQQNPYQQMQQSPYGGGMPQQQFAQAPQQQQPQLMRCGRCQQVFGIPPGHAQVKCPKCMTVNACPAPAAAPQPSIPTMVYNQPLGVQQAATVGQPGPPPSGRKKALLVGINYPRTSAELRGCINDVQRMSGVLTQMYGFPRDQGSMLVLTDDKSDRRFRPTRANILEGMRWLAQGAQPGDVLFFHFSGHGAQQEDPSYSEEDGYDETICPEDFQRAGMIVDDEIFDAMVAPLPAGVKLTAVMDCCHSGTGLDLPFELRYGSWTEEDNPCHSEADVVLISGCQDSQTSADCGGSSYSRPCGAMTTALCNTLERTRTPTHAELLTGLRGELRSGGFDQVPSLTSSQRFDPNKPFSLSDHIEGNSNQLLGRHFRKRKHPQRANLLQGGLGDMLMEGAIGFMVADMAGDALGGLLMGGGDDGGLFEADGGDDGGDFFGDDW